jgi:hypothetical protein
LLNAIGDADATDEDVGFDDGSIFTGESTNTVDPDPEPYANADCIAIEGPAASVLDSETGAFADRAEWLDGQWVDWAED